MMMSSVERETNLTVGLTWYLSSTMRLMTNYVNVLEMDRPGSVFDGNTMSLFQARFQIEFLTGSFNL